MKPSHPDSPPDTGGRLLAFSRSREERWLLRLVREHGSPLLVLDRQRVRSQYRALAKALPGIGLHYAVKVLPNQDVIDTLVAEGAGFAIAGRGELALLRRAQVAPRTVIHTHPIKKPREIIDALRFGCTRFVFDNVTELEKFQPYRHRVGLILRIAFRNPLAGSDLSQKFGCALADIPALLQRAHALKLQVRGLSFHVGSQCPGPDAHVTAIRQTLAMMRDLRASRTDVSWAGIGLLDIGGGFPADYGTAALDIDSFCAPIRAALAAAPKHLQVIAEPGRVLVASAVTGVFSVVGKALRAGRPWYYLDDGVYGSFSGQVFEHAHYPIRVFRHGPRRPSVLAGPTCDSVDVIGGDHLLPDLQIGDLVVADMMGAYTAASATDFNSVSRTPVVSVGDIDEQELAI
jgi:ornithine decarboxylase